MVMTSLIEKYNFRSIDKQIGIIEAAAREIKRLSGGIKAIDINVDSILAFTYILNQNVSDIVELEGREVEV